MRDRVRPPQELEPVLDQLKADGVFETKQKGMMFAAALGYHLRGADVSDVEIDPFGEGIRLDYFKTPDDDGFIDALAVTAANDLNAVHPDEQSERVETFEKYALVGLREMKRACYDARPENPLDGILTLMDAMSAPANDELPGLDATARQVNELL
jgi:dnd system-associated protein 4